MLEHTQRNGPPQLQTQQSKIHQQTNPKSASDTIIGFGELATM